MTGAGPGGARLPESFLRAGSASFTEFLGQHAPHLLPSGRALPAGTLEAPHGTTVLALAHDGGVLVAGDRRATAGNMIANRDMQKVFATDDWSAVAIAGTAGVALEMVELFQVELEHYEKIEGALLSLEGKANRLAAMIRGNLPLAMQGLAVVPLFAGFDPDRGLGRIFSYDVAGGCYEEQAHHSVGSGAVFARGALKKLWRPGLDETAAVDAAVQALYDAADDDSATGGPDLSRRIWPTLVVLDADGARFLDEPTLEGVVSRVVERRRDDPGGARR